MKVLLQSHLCRVFVAFNCFVIYLLQSTMDSNVTECPESVAISWLSCLEILMFMWSLVRMFKGLSLRSDITFMDETLALMFDVVPIHLHNLGYKDSHPQLSSLQLFGTTTTIRRSSSCLPPPFVQEFKIINRTPHYTNITPPHYDASKSPPHGFPLLRTKNLVHKTLQP